MNSLECNVAKPVKFLQATHHSCRLASGRPADPCGAASFNVSGLMTNVSVLSLPPDRWPDATGEPAGDEPKVALQRRICHLDDCRADAPMPVAGYDAGTGVCLNTPATITFRMGYNATQGIRYAWIDIRFVNATAGNSVADGQQSARNC